MFRAFICPSSGVQVVTYCMWYSSALITMDCCMAVDYIGSSSAPSSIPHIDEGAEEEPILPTTIQQTIIISAEYHMQ
jgi:hypothetical protein